MPCACVFAMHISVSHSHTFIEWHRKHILDCESGKAKAMATATAKIDGKTRLISDLDVVRLHSRALNPCDFSTELSNRIGFHSKQLFMKLLFKLFCHVGTEQRAKNGFLHPVYFAHPSRSNATFLSQIHIDFHSWKMITFPVQATASARMDHNHFR